MHSSGLFNWLRENARNAISHIALSDEFCDRAEDARNGEPIDWAPFKRWWTSQCTADVAFDDEFMSLAARSGCKALFLGLETISQASLNIANKRHNRPAEYGEVIRRFHAHGMAVQAGMVFGFDQDDRTIFRTTVEFYRSAGLDSATVSVLIPFPNTPLFKRLDSEGRILTRDWSKYNGKKDVVFQPAMMSPGELLMGMEWAARQFYSIPSIIERMARSKTGLWWNIARNMGYHLALQKFGNVGFDPGTQGQSSSANSSGETICPRIGATGRQEGGASWFSKSIR